MYQDNITLCGASAYEKKFYFNQDFNALPDHVKNFQNSDIFSVFLDQPQLF